MPFLPIAVMMPHIEQLPKSAPDFIIVGPMRAGTTMLRLMLNNHPDLALVGEFEESVAMLGDSGFPSTTEYRHWLQTHRVAQTRKYNLPDSLVDYPGIVDAMWSQVASEHPNTKLLGCTVHSRIDRLLDLWPDTKLICLVRDPRDVCRSCVGMGWHGHPAEAVPYWLRPVTRWESIKPRLADNQWTLIRYEDLLGNPRVELDKCCQLLGIEYNDHMLGFHQDSSYEQLDASLAEQWKRKMSSRCAEIIDARCLPMMRALGYEPSVPQPRDAGAFESLMIKLSSRANRLRWRVRRYGLGLTLSWALAKRLARSNTWRQRVHTRINEIDMKHLR